MRPAQALPDLAGRNPQVLAAQRSVGARSQKAYPRRGVHLSKTRYRCLAAISYQSGCL
jgi:hypothetical protein